MNKKPKKNRKKLKKNEKTENRKKLKKNRKKAEKTRGPSKKMERKLKGNFLDFSSFVSFFRFSFLFKTFPFFIQSEYQVSFGT